MRITDDINTSWAQLKTLGVPITSADSLEEVKCPFPSTPSLFWEMYLHEACETHKLQRELSRCIEFKCYVELSSSLDVAGKARLVACSVANAGSWILAMPRSAYLTLSCNNYRYAARLRLGVPLIADCIVMCECGKGRASSSDHYLSCHLERGRSVRRRHDNLIRTLAALLRRAGGFVHVEPYDLQLDHHLRPDLTAHFVASGVAVDGSVVHPAAATYARLASVVSLSAADRRERKKGAMYNAMASAENLVFHPLVMESFGGFGPKSYDFIKQIATDSGGLLGLSELVQVLSVALQRGNAFVMAAGHRRALRALRLQKGLISMRRG